MEMKKTSVLFDKQCYQDARWFNTDLNQKVSAQRCGCCKTSFPDTKNGRCVFSTRKALFTQMTRRRTYGVNGWKSMLYGIGERVSMI